MKNRGMMVCLPLKLEEEVIKYCNEYKIVRKDREGNIVPFLGSGIVACLKRYLLGKLPSDRFGKAPRERPNDESTKDEVLDSLN